MLSPVRVFCGRAVLGRTPRAVKSSFHHQRAACCAPQDQTFTAQHSPPLRLMPLGGSITHGVGSSDQNGYRKALLELLHSKGLNIRLVGSRRTGTMVNNDHEGWRGFRIDQVETKAKASAAKLRPHIFTVNIGSNDCLQGHKLDEASKRLSRLLEGLWAASPGSTVVLSSLLANRDAQVDLRITGFNREIETMAREMALAGKRVVFVDMHGGDGPVVGDLVDDGTHPNDAGYAKMARIWLRGIQEASSGGLLAAPKL